MNLLDWLLLILVGTYALSGYWQGFVTGAFATAGLLLGGGFGIWVAPIVLEDADPSIWVSLGALFIVILSASLGQAILQYTGARIRDRIVWQPVRAVDALGGAILSSAAVLVVAWALGVAVSGTSIGGISPLVRNSTVLGKVDRTLPRQATEALQAFNTVVGTTFFPRYLEPFAPERIVQVGPVPKRIVEDPDVVGVREGVLKVRGTNDCGSGVEGTGFLYKPGRLMTNAHVVAGVDEPEVELPGGSVEAEVVAYDPDLDLAVLAFDSGAIDPLPFDDDGDGEPRQGVAVLGYPQDGPYDAQPGRVRSEQRLRSPDIYGQGSVIREVLSMRALVRPGNSGGPVVDSEGDVVGVVFAASVSDSRTGYALTDDQAAETAALGATRSEPVSTGDCVS